MIEIGAIDPGAAIATLVGPIIAVAITLWLQARDRSRDRKETLLRQLLATRLTPADPAFNIAIALIPVEFRAHAAVRTAYKDFISAANLHASDDIQKKKDELILSVMRVLGFNTESAQDVLRDPYASVGWGNALQLHEGALRAIPRLADALERTATTSEETRVLLERAVNAPRG